MPKIGLEIHGYIDAKEKLFCTCKAEHNLKSGVKPNTNICPICTGQPGSKPMLPNSKAVEKIIEIALILGCKINKKLSWQRKHYSWPDLPKGYQNTLSGTYATPVGEEGKFNNINITEVHLEEDPASWNPETGEIDYNRSGSPLVEIVTEPDFKSSEEVVEWLKQLILTLDYIKAIDKTAGIKADVNVSLPEKNKGAKRIEIKNVNSITNIKNAIEAEIKRQEKQDYAKEQETRRYNSEKNTTEKMRSKEQAQDYRFIADPDLPALKFEEARIVRLKKALPQTPQEKLSKLIKKYKIEKKPATILTKKLELVEFFEKVIKKVPKQFVIPWVTNELLSVLNYNKKELEEVDINAEHFIELMDLLQKKKITELKAQEILRSWKEKSTSPKKQAEQNASITDTKEIEKIIDEVIKENLKAVEDYKAGEKKSLNFLIGQVMKQTQKRADFRTVKDILEKKL